MSDSTKHSEVSHQLREEIAAGKYASSGRFPSEAQLVKRFGVSRPTVARALRDLQAAGLIERRAGSGTYLSKQEMRGPGAPTPQLSLIMPDLGMVEILDVIAGELASLCRTADINLLWSGQGEQARSAEGDTNRMRAECDSTITRGCAGTFFAPVELCKESATANAGIAECLRKAGIPAILIDRDFTPYPERSELDLISVDHIRSGFLAASHLIRLGCRNVAFVRRPYSAGAVEERILGVRSAFLNHGVELAPDFLQTGDPSQLGFIKSLTAGRRFDALICANDRTAAMVIQSLTKLGIHVPKDIRIVGFDDLRYATLLSVPLTTVHQPCRDIALAAFRALMERLESPTLPARQIRINPHLVIRESCGAYLGPRPI